MMAAKKKIVERWVSVDESDPTISSIIEEKEEEAKLLPCKDLTSAPKAGKAHSIGMGRWEVKFNTVYTSVTSLVTGGDLYCCNIIGVGTDYDERIGRRICGKSVEIIVKVLDPGTAGYADAVRIVMFVDKQSNGLQTSAADFLDTGVVSNAYFAPHNLTSYPKRFHWLLDEHMGTMTTIGSIDTFKVGRDLVKRTLKWPHGCKLVSFGTSTSGGSIPTTNALYIGLYSMTADATSSHNARYSYSVRFHFEDA